jgi:hypothetical protein
VARCVRRTVGSDDQRGIDGHDGRAAVAQDARCPPSVRAPAVNHRGGIVGAGELNAAAAITGDTEATPPIVAEGLVTRWRRDDHFAAKE